MAHGYPDYTFFAYPVNVPAGGTGLTTVPIGALLIGNGIGSMTTTSVGSADQVLRIPQGGGLPDFGTINLADSAAVGGLLPVASGGSGSAAPALVQGTGITISGSWPNQTITNSSAYAALADPLPVAHGGTGTTTPALVQGGNISITGTWPNQTVALAASPSVVALTATPTSGFYSLLLKHNEVGGQAATIQLYDAGNSATRGYLGGVYVAGAFVQAALAGDVFVRADTGSLWLSTSTTYGLKLDQSQIVTLAHPLAVTSGGTGQGTCSAGQLLIGSGSNTAAWGTPPGARVYNDAAESIPNLTATALTFDQERYNNGAMHSTGTNPSRLTASQSGVYMLTGHAQFSSNATGYRSIQIWLNGSTIIAWHDFLSLINQAQNMSIATLWHLSATDYVELRVVQSSGGALNIVAAADTSPEFAAQWLGP